MKIITADQRLQTQRYIKGAIFGQAGIGKTSLLKTLDSTEGVLFIDLEAGSLCLGDMAIDTLKLEKWEECQGVCAALCGADPYATHPNQPYGEAFVARAREVLGDLSKYHTIFIDSITVASRLALKWAQRQPAVLNDGKENGWALYGLLGQVVMHWLTRLQHANCNIWLVGVMEGKLDNLKRMMYAPQIEGNKTARELPALVDEVLVMGLDQEHQRVIYTSATNPFGYPAKDRSGQLDEIEKPNLQIITNKMTGGKK